MFTKDVTCATCDLMTDLELQFHGPLQWLHAASANYLFDYPAAGQPGVYVWTVPTISGEYCYYVGETGRSLGKRHEEHLLAYLGGLYRIYDADLLRHHQKRLLWPGMWQGERLRLVSRFLGEMPELAVYIKAYLDLLRIYIAPLSVDRRVRERVEAALAEALATGNITLQDTDIRLNSRGHG